MLCKVGHAEVQQCCRHGRTTSGSLLMYSKGTAGTIWALGTRVASRPPIEACNLRKANSSDHTILPPAHGGMHCRQTILCAIRFGTTLLCP